MPKQPTIYSKCFEYTTCAWSEVDSDWWRNDDRVWSETVYAETASKARYSAFLGMERSMPITDIRVRRKPSCDQLLREEHPMVAGLTAKQLDKAKHAIGFDSMQPFYRNRYVSVEDADWEDLIAKSLAGRMPFQRDQWLYLLTDLGCEVIRSLLPILRSTWEARNSAKHPNSSTTIN